MDARRGVILAVAVLVAALTMLAWSPAPYRFYGERNRRLSEISLLWCEMEASQVSLLIYVRSWVDSKIAEIASLGLDPYHELSEIPTMEWSMKYARWLSGLSVKSQISVDVRAQPYHGEVLDTQQLKAIDAAGQLGGVYISGWFKARLEASVAWASLQTAIRAAHPARIYLLYHMSEAARAAAEKAIRARLDYGRRDGARVIAYRYSELYCRLLREELRRVPWPTTATSLKVRYSVTVQVRYHHRYYEDYLGLGPATRVTKLVFVEIEVSERRACDRSPLSKVFAGGGLTGVEYAGRAWRTGVFVYFRSWVERGHVRYEGSSFRLEEELKLSF